MQSGNRNTEILPPSTTFLLGAGASVAAGVPVAYTLSDELIDILVKEGWANTELKRLTRNSRNDMFDAYDFIRFESLVYWIRDVYKDARFFDFLEFYTEPSPLQLCIAKWAKNGSTIVTPHFDDLLERAYIENGVIPRTINAHRCDCNSYVPGIGDVIKLHGSWCHHADGKISSGSEPIHASVDVIVSESPGNMLNHTAAELLARCVDGMTLIVIGYSASDSLDIVPALGNCSPSVVYWVSYGNHGLIEYSLDEYCSAFREESRNLPWIDLLKRWSQKGADAVILNGRAEEALYKLGVASQVVSSRPVCDIDWKKHLRKWSAGVRHHDSSGLGLASLLFGELSRFDLSRQAARESRGRLDGKCGWSSARRLYELAECAYFDDGADYSSVIRMARCAQRKASRIDDKYVYNNALTLEGRCLFLLERYDEAIGVFSSEELQKVKRRWDIRKNGYCDCWIGRCYLWSGRERKAISYLSCACRKLSNSGDVDSLADAQFGLGLAKAHIGALVEARSILEENEYTCRLHGLHAQRCYALTELSKLEAFFGDFDNIESNMQFSISFLEAFRRDEAAEAYLIYATTMMLRSDYRFAETLLHKAANSITEFSSELHLEIQARLILCRIILDEFPEYPNESEIDFDFARDSSDFAYVGFILALLLRLRGGKISKTNFDSNLFLSKLPAVYRIELAMISRKLEVETRKIRILRKNAALIASKNGIFFDNP